MCMRVCGLLLAMKENKDDVIWMIYSGPCARSCSITWKKRPRRQRQVNETGSHSMSRYFRWRKTQQQQAKDKTNPNLRQVAWQRGCRWRDDSSCSPAGSVLCVRNKRMTPCFVLFDRTKHNDRPNEKMDQFYVQKCVALGSGRIVRIV